MANERITEDIVRSHFKTDPLFKSVKFEEQKSYNKRVIDLLQTASKSGKGVGKPEFIVSFPADSNYLIVVECKADIAQHESRNTVRHLPAADYAVDGVLHYAQKLSADFTVIAVAVSGQTIDELQVSHFLWKKGEPDFETVSDNKLLSINDYLKLFANEQFADRLKYANIVLRAIELNEEYNNYSIPEQDRNTMVSVILLSLLHKPFRQSYESETSVKSLGDAMLKAIENALALNEVRNRDAMLNEFNKIFVQPIFTQQKIKNKKEKEPKNSLFLLKEMVKYLHANVYPLVNMEDSGFDVLGQFYTEFIRYSASQQKQGLVLTPFHITDLFCDLGQLTVNDTIYDPCCGTAGFLVSGMKRLMTLAGNNNEQKLNIRKKQLVGVELRPSMYAYACSNMLLKGDGKSNIYCGDCFQLAEETATHKPTVAFLNPPYDVGNARQMEFIEHALKMVAPQNGRVVAIVQMSCAIKNDKELIAVKKRILQNHHLKAVLSMPDDLFYPVGVVTCVMVFEANKPNRGLKTWFGYFKNDGFEKRKNQGRIDAREKWKGISKKWIDTYNDKDEVAGLSVKQHVTERDEWCVESYMKTDYSIIKQIDFEKKLKEYLAFKFLNDINIKAIALPQINIDEISKLELVKISDIFDVKNSQSLELLNCEQTEDGICFVSRTSRNNGIAARIEQLDDLEPMPAGAITVALSGSVLSSFYQNEPFYTAYHIACLYPKQKLTKEEMIYYACVIEQNKYRYSFGRQANRTLKNILVPKIK